MTPSPLRNEIMLLARGLLSALLVGALIGLLHYFGVPVPNTLTLPVMAVGSYVGIKSLIGIS